MLSAEATAIFSDPKAWHPVARVAGVVGVRSPVQEFTVKMETVSVEEPFNTYANAAGVAGVHEDGGVGAGVPSPQPELSTASKPKTAVRRYVARSNIGAKTEAFLATRGNCIAEPLGYRNTRLNFGAGNRPMSLTQNGAEFNKVNCFVHVGRIPKEPAYTQ